PLTVCLKKGGDHCHALAGETKFLCVTGGSGCYSVHPSDTAVALLALDALVEVAGRGRMRILPVEQYFAGPSVDVTRENILARDELVTRVYLQRPAEDSLRESGRSSLYLKTGERAGGDFALVSVAAVLILNGPSIRRMPVVLGGVAPVPYRAFQVEAYLRGRPVGEVDAVFAASLALPNANPLADNGYKITLATNLVKRAITRLLAPESQD
ncbi:MAG: xanthine dehydrogenase family protein subunit M, partial [Stenotrophomonas maltophilia]